MVLDHVVVLVRDAVETARELRERHGLGSERGAFHDFAGTRNHSVPLEPPAYLEFLTIEDRELAARTEPGRRALECEARGFGFLAWALRAEDLEEVAERLNLEIVDHTIPQQDGTLRGWRSVTGPAHLPFFIDYPNNGDRVGRWQAMYDRVGHTSEPGGFASLTISGDDQEHRDWLGGRQLPLRFVSGRDGLVEARIASAHGELVIR